MGGLLKNLKHLSLHRLAWARGHGCHGRMMARTQLEQPRTGDPYALFLAVSWDSLPVPEYLRMHYAN